MWLLSLELILKEALPASRWTSLLPLVSSITPTKSLVPRYVLDLQDLTDPSELPLKSGNTVSTT